MDELGEYVRRAEELGYSTVWHTDRLLPTVPPDTAQHGMSR